MSDQQFDIIQKARHYNVHASGIECIELVRHLPFDIGNSVKYIWRCGEKGNHDQDIDKALYYARDAHSMTGGLVVSERQHNANLELAKRFSDAEKDARVGRAVVHLTVAAGRDGGHRRESLDNAIILMGELRSIQ